MIKASAQARLNTKGASRIEIINPVPEYAASAWIVEADLAKDGEAPDRRFFAVGLAGADEAVEAVLRYPGMLPEDRCLAIRVLSAEEIFRLRLRPCAIRRYDGPATR